MHYVCLAGKLKFLTGLEFFFDVQTIKGLIALIFKK